MYWNSGGLIATYKDVSVDPIDAAERDYTEYLAPPTTVYPGSDLRSGLLSAHQLVGDAVELRLDALRSRRDQRSEEHTSELQSLMRISYAVFCLKKKKNNNQSNNYIATTLHYMTTVSER